jgi:hypothetical protein
MDKNNDPSKGYDKGSKESQVRGRVKRSTVQKYLSQPLHTFLFTLNRCMKIIYKMIEIHNIFKKGSNSKGLPFKLADVIFYG